MSTQIYIASLSDYNAGILHGSWIELEGLEIKVIQEKIDQLLAASPTTKTYGEKAEEWAIHDYELGSVSIGAYTDLETILSIVEALEEHGPAFAIYYEDCGDLDAACSNFEAAHQGAYDSLLQYAIEVFDEYYASAIPDHLHSYIDYEAFARDIATEGCFMEQGYVFRPV